MHVSHMDHGERAVCEGQLRGRKGESLSCCDLKIDKIFSVTPSVLARHVCLYDSLASQICIQRAVYG